MFLTPTPLEQPAPQTDARWNQKIGFFGSQRRSLCRPGGGSGSTVDQGEPTAPSKAATPTRLHPAPKNLRAPVPTGTRRF